MLPVDRRKRSLFLKVIFYRNSVVLLKFGRISSCVNWSRR